MIDKKLTIFDLHCDTPHNIDKNKFKHIEPHNLYRQNYVGAVFAHFIHPKAHYPFVDVIRLIVSTMAYLRKKRNIHIIRCYRELDEDKVNIILGVEGGHIFDNSFTQIEALYFLGVRVFTLTWNNSNKLAHSALEADKKGITKKGKKYIKELNDYNVIIDLSHASTRTVLDVCDIFEHQVIASHSCVRALNPTFLRNIDDEAIKAIVQKGGVVGINFSHYHLGGHGIVDHIDYLKDNFGLECAAIGSDFDGINDAVIPGPRDLGSLRKEFLKRGYKKTEISKVFSGNFLRIFRNSRQSRLFLRKSGSVDSRRVP